jgi:hypothetical protein
VPEWHCFSLQLPDRTLDFAAPTDQEAVAWCGNVCFRHFILTKRIFAKTGSGQNTGKVETERRFCRTIGFRTLCYQQGVWEAGKPLVMGDVLWKRAALRFDAAMWAKKGKERRPSTAQGTPAVSMSRQEMVRSPPPPRLCFPLSL